MIAARSLVLLCLLTVGVRIAPTPQPVSPDDSVREYVRLAVALGERDPDALDYYYGPQNWVKGIREHAPTLSQIKNSALEAVQKLEGTRHAFLVGQLQAIAARADLLLGHPRPFDHEARALFGVQLTPASTEDLAAVRAEIARLLPGKGDLAARYAAFDARFTIPPERLPAVMSRALQACQDETLAHWQLPQEEKVSFEYVHDKPWSAYSHYQGAYHSVIQVNIDLGLTVDRALRLACHEGYPGHHAINVLTEQYLVRGQNRPELSVQPTFSPQSLLTESAATVAPEIAFPLAARIRLEREVLFPLAGLKTAEAEHYLRVEQLVDELSPAELSIARDYLDGKLEFVRAGTALEDQALMAHPEATLRYLNEYRSYVVTYTEGKRRLVSRLALHKDAWATFRQFLGV